MKTRLTILMLILATVCGSLKAEDVNITFDGKQKLYFNSATSWTLPWCTWNGSGAIFSAYFYGTSGSKFAGKAEQINGDIFAVTVPAGTWHHVIFTRHAPGTTIFDFETSHGFWSKSCDIKLEQYQWDNYISEFNLDGHGTDREWNKLYSEQPKNGTTPAALASKWGLTIENISVCDNSTGDPYTLTPNTIDLGGGKYKYNYDMRAHAWFKSTDNGATWTNVDGKAGVRASADEGDMNYDDELVGAKGSVTYYYLYAKEANDQRLMCVKVDKDCQVTCEITSFEVTPTAVNVGDNTYTMDGIVAFTKAEGSLIIECDGKTTTIADPESPQTFSLHGLTADGKPETFRAYFSSMGSCEMIKETTAPLPTSDATTHPDKNIAPLDNITLTPDADGTGDSWEWTLGDVFVKKSPAADNTCPVATYDRDTVVTYVYTEYNPLPTLPTNLMDNGSFEDVSIPFKWQTGYKNSNVLNGNKIWDGSAADQKDIYDLPAFHDTYGYFGVTTNANTYWKLMAHRSPKDGSYMAVIDGDEIADKQAWYASTDEGNPNLKLMRGTTYLFSFWVANINNIGELINNGRRNCAKLQFHIRCHSTEDGLWYEKDLGQPIDLNDAKYMDFNWHQNSSTFSTRAYFGKDFDADQVTISVVDKNNTGLTIGNDFALDDIQFRAVSVMSKSIKAREFFPVKFYEPPTVVEQPVITITQTPACGMTDFAMSVKVDYTTLNNKYPITLQLTDNVYGNLFTTPLTIDPAVNPNSITIPLSSAVYAMLVADGAVHTLTAKITRIDGAGVDKGGSNSATYTAPGVPAINTPVTTELNVSCDQTTFDLQVATEYNAFKGTKLHYDWDGAEWTDVENPSLSYKESTLQTATGKLKNLVADGKNHTLRVYSDNTTLDCEITITVPAPYRPKISLDAATINPYICGATQFSVTVEATFENGQGHDLIIEDWKGTKQTIATTPADTKKEATFTYDWETPTVRTFNVYFDGAPAACNHTPSFTSPAEPQIDNIQYTITPSADCTKSTYDLTVTFDYYNQDGTLSVDMDGIAPTTAPTFIPDSHKKESGVAVFTSLLADGGTSHMVTVQTAGGAHNCSANKTLSGVPVLPVVNTVILSAPVYVCGDTQFGDTLTVTYTNAQGKDILVKEGSAVLKQIAGVADAGTHTMEIPLAFDFGADHTLTVAIDGREACGQPVVVTAPAKPQATATYKIVNESCDKTTYDVEVTVIYTNQDGTLSVDVDGIAASTITPAFEPDQASAKTLTATVKDLPADGAAGHVLNVAFTGGTHACPIAPVTFTAPYGPQIGTATATVLPYACGDDKYKVKVEVPFTNGQGHNLIIEDWNENKQSLTTAATDSKAEHTFLYDWETPTTHAYKIYFVGAESCNNHTPSFVAPVEPKLENIVTAIPTSVACGATTFDMSVTFDYINQDGTALDVNVDGTIHGTLSSPFVPGSTTKQTVTATFTGLPADGATARKLNIVFTGGTHTCGPEQVSFDAPMTPAIDTAHIVFSTPGCSDLTTTLTFDLDYTYQQGTLTYWVDGLSPQTATYSQANPAAQQLTGLTVAGIPADGKSDHVLHVSFDGANSCVKSYTLPAVPFAPVIDDVTITGVPTIVACDAENYTISISFSSHYTPVPAGKTIVLTYDSLCQTKTITSLALTDFPYNLTAYNIARGADSISVAFEDTPDCKKTVKFSTPARETCVKDTAHICLGETYSWPGHGSYTPTTTGEHQYKDNADSLFLFVHADPNISLLASDMICEDENEIRLPFAITSGTPNRFDIVIADQNFSQAYDGKDTIVLARPASIQAGTYKATVTVRDSLVSCFNTAQSTFTIALSDHVFSKWTDVLFIDNSDKRFTAYQWFADGTAMSGETLQRLYDPNGLSGSSAVYYCQLTTTDGKTLYTCPQTFDDVTPSRTVDTTPAKVKVTTMYDQMGRVIKSTPHFGMYIVVEELENGEVRTRKIAIYE